MHKNCITMCTGLTESSQAKLHSNYLDDERAAARLFFDAITTNAMSALLLETVID